MSRYITVYVPISKYISTENGEEHVIANFEKAVSRETYDKLCSKNANDIQNRIDPIVKDMRDLINRLENNDFTYEFDQSSATIYHAYCPTLDKDHVIGSGKDFKGLDGISKVELLKQQYIDAINTQINHRIQQARNIIDDFEYHPIQIEITELDLMTKDTSYTLENMKDDDLETSDLSHALDAVEAEMKENFINTVITDPKDPYDNPIDHMDR